MCGVCLFSCLPVFIFSVSICTFLTRIFTAIMPMVAAGLIIDDPTLQPVRRLVSLVGTRFFWFCFELCLWNVCCSYCWAGPSSLATWAAWPPPVCFHLKWVSSVVSHRLFAALDLHDWSLGILGSVTDNSLCLFCFYSKTTLSMIQ